MSPAPKAGDVVWVDLDPVVGTEQAGRRPALVISSALFHDVSRRVVICPITSNMKPWPTKIVLPQTCITRGMVLIDQIRAVDREARRLRFIETCSAEFVQFVRGHVGRLLDLPVG